MRRYLKRAVPSRTARDTLLLATWNLRDFDSNKFGHGPRLPESYYYIAEVLSAFDLIAVQEVNRDIGPFENVMRILGPNWSYIATDVTEGRSGNSERMTFVYDTRKVWFKYVAGEIVLPKNVLVNADRQFARSPFIVDFQSGWLKFSLCTVHLYYGSTSGAGYERRVSEIEEIGKFLAKRAKRERKNMILLGDMNVVSPDDRTMKALKKSGFVVPNGLALPTNMLRNKYYDQIAFLYKRDELELGDSESTSGVFDVFHTVFRPRDSETYYPLGKGNGKWPDTPEERKNYFLKEWRTWQISDHLPLWVELKIDFTEKYLKRIEGGG
jgi:endonuclease/exonuclease/phosphatase family metal-dependent hydrolase